MRIKTIQQVLAQNGVEDPDGQVEDAMNDWAAIKGEKLLQFKTYVHERLDLLGVPKDPEPEQNASHGCRIEGRLNFIASHFRLDKLTYRGYVIDVDKDASGPNGGRGYLFYPGDHSGPDHDYDLVGEDYKYCGNCRFHSTIEECMSEIDELIDATK